MKPKRTKKKKFHCDGTDEGCNWEVSDATLAEFDRMVAEHEKRNPGRRMTDDEMDRRWPT